MARRVPLARRNLFQDRRRALLATLGVAVALLLVLVLDGVFAGAMHQVTAYIDASPADLFVSQQGVKTMHMSTTSLPPDAVPRAAAVDGVAWAEGLWYTSSLVEARGSERLTYVFGYDEEVGRAGPRRLAAGRPPGGGEIVIDDILADETGVGVGDEVRLFGEPWRVSGLSTKGTNIVNTTVYVDRSEFERVRGPAVAYVLVGADRGVDADDLARRVREALPGTTVQTRGEFSRQEARVVRDMSTDVMAIMTAIGLLIALAVIALTLFAVTLAKIREFGVLKALGATPIRLGGLVLAQAAWTVVLGLAVAVGLALVVGAAIDRVAPNVLVLVVPASVVRVGASALLVGVVGSVIPLLRIVRVDPASAFRSA